METCHSAGFILWFVFIAAKSPTEFIWIPWIHRVGVQMHMFQQLALLRALDPCNTWSVSPTWYQGLDKLLWNEYWQRLSVETPWSFKKSNRSFHGMSFCRWKLQKKKSRQKRCRTQSSVDIHYDRLCLAILCWYFVDTCCFSFDGNMGNTVNQLVAA